MKIDAWLGNKESMNNCICYLEFLYSHPEHFKTDSFFINFAGSTKHLKKLSDITIMIIRLKNSLWWCDNALDNPNGLAVYNRKL